MSKENTIKSTLQSGWQQKNNNGKFGFFPTPIEVVKMEMDLIDFSEVSPDTPISLADFTGGEGTQLYEGMHMYLKEKGLDPISYYNEITQQRYEEAKANYGHDPNFHMLNTDFFFMKCRHKEGKSYKRNIISVVRNNPPYTFIEKFGETVRAEDLFFVENTKYNIAGGIQIFELPMHQLIQQQSLMKKITYRYEDVAIFKFPKDVFDKFKQVVVIGVKKKNDFNDIEIAEEWIEMIKADELLYLDNVPGPCYKLTDKVLKKTKEVNVFRDGRENDFTLTNGLNSVLDGLLSKEQGKDHLQQRVKRLDSTPIIERLVGHRAIELNAGKFNGLTGNVLVEGGSQKVIEIHQENDGEKIITEEIEVIKPYIEITNADGDIIFKDH